MNVARISVKQSSEVPHNVTGCLRVLGVKFDTRKNFWLTNEGELEWLLKDAHQAWREKIKAAHTDRGGTHDEAARWNVIWDRVKRLFLARGVSLDDQKVLHDKEPEPPKVKALVSITTRLERRQRRRTKERVRLRNLNRTKSGIPLELPLIPRNKRWQGWKAVAVAACLMVFFGMPSRLSAAQITFEWPEMTNSELKGYRLWYGGAPGDYTNVITVAAPATNAVVTNLSAGTYYFALTAYGTNDVNSEPSNELRETILPAPGPLRRKFTFSVKSSNDLLGSRQELVTVEVFSDVTTDQQFFWPTVVIGQTQ